MSDHPSMRGRERSDEAARRPASSDAGRQLSRSRLPLPPVPAPSRNAARPAAAAAPAVPTGPRTTMAPFQAVPSPDHADLVLDDVRPSPIAAPVASSPAAPPVERRKRARTATSVPDRPRSAWHEAESALVSTGASGLRSSGSAPRVPRQTTAGGSSAPAYGDWTKPSRAGETPGMDADLPMAPEALGYAPGTTAIPDRPVSRRRKAAAPADRFADDVVEDDRVQDSPLDVQAPPAVRGPGTGPVMGNRAAQRAERQAADAVRRKAERQRGSAVAVLDDEPQARIPQRVIKGLVAMTIVALGVLGVYTVVSPETAETSATSPAVASAGPEVTPEVDALPDLPTAPLDVEPIVAAPVRVPVTVLNSTEITGLAAKIAETVVTGGWESPGVGAYTAGDVAASTVFYTPGDENQRQAAEQLKAQFPQLQGPAERFFELPPEVTTPGLVVVAAGEWQP
jgi:hypothetical protein